MQDIVFILFVLVTIVSAAVTALSRNLVHSVFSLMATFFGVAGLYVFLLADFLAVAQIMVYVGGILILLIFGVMLTQKVQTVVIIHGNINRISALILGFIVLSLLFYAVNTTTWYHSASEVPVLTETVDGIGHLLMSQYLLAFELASMLLLGVLIGAANIARGDAK